MHFYLILDLVITVQLTKQAIYCVKDFFRIYHPQQTVLLVTDGENPNFPVEIFGATLTVINGNYGKNFEKNHFRVDSVVILLGCYQNLSKILETVKKNRVISVRAKVLILVDIRCFFKPPAWILNEIRRVLNPACSAVITFNGFAEDFFWLWSYGWKNGSSDSGLIGNRTCLVDIPGVADFRGRDLNIAAVLQEPYVRRENKEGEFENGLEIEIIRNIVDSMGMKCRWVRLPANEPARVLKNEQGEYAGMFGMLDRLDADITFGGIVYQVGRFFASEVLFSHTEDSLSWLIPSAPKADNLGAIFSVFSFTTWFLIGFSAVLFAVVVSIGCIGWKTMAASLFQTWAILLDQGVSIDTNTTRRHFFWLLFVIYCLIVTNAYRSSLITALTSETQGKWFEMPEDAVDSGELTYFFPSGLALFRETASYDPMWRTILQPGRHQYIENFFLLRNISETRHGMVLCIRNPCQFEIYAQHLVGRDLKAKLIFLNQRFARFPAAMFMAPGSVLHPTVNRRTLWLKETGLIDHWMEKLERLSRLSALYNDPNNYDGDGPQKLSILHLQSTFIIYFMFLSISVCIFIFERCLSLKI